MLNKIDDRNLLICTGSDSLAGLQANDASLPIFNNNFPNIFQNPKKVKTNDVTIQQQLRSLFGVLHSNYFVHSPALE